MVDIGEDIRDVLHELGTPFVILKLGVTTPIAGEFLDYEMYYEQSSEFVRQFCYSGDFAYDSKVEQGDLIQFDNKTFLMMNVKKTIFERETVDYSNFFVLCNSLGRFARAVETRDGTTKKISTVWSTIQDNVYACMVSMAAGSENLGAVTTIQDKFTLYTQKFPDVFADDRWYPDISDLTEFYRVVVVDKYRFGGMLTIRLIEDER